MPWISSLNIQSLFSWPSRSLSRQLLLGVLIGFSLSLTSTEYIRRSQKRKKKEQLEHFTPRPIELRSNEVVDGIAGLIGNTPLVRINSLSNALGVEILGKAEFLNPGGSVKDRVALQMINDAENLGYLRPNTGSRIFEGTVGSTGISIATIARAKGYDTTIIMPDDVAEEKVKALRVLGADVERVRPASIVDKKQYVNLARLRAKQFGQRDTVDEGRSDKNTLSHSFESPSHTAVVSIPPQHVEFDVAEPEDGGIHLTGPIGYFADQFENRSNFDAHFNGTGPEIWQQTSGRIDAFVAGAGTGGTVAGTGQYLKSMNEDIIVAIADPDGSGLLNKVKFGVMFDKREAEGTKRRHQVDTVVEGIITDAEAVAMSRYLVQHDGLFLGSSSACNLMACVKLIQKQQWKGERTVVTILCDSGTRHYSKVSLAVHLQKGLPTDSMTLVLVCFH
ncbi:hypothetical protein CVT24_004570 [Panaeolus cyanescens]|uniref:Tryptophan synthase beta chain-like PALP domain-containing protein n=1 Tax=Panaeolus cyanescens TaxID=181874 RepID=A0A409VDB3_9AGAR|nr:hypothetical protein CVT24_004570 [Panaeolus cyanescens]